MTLDEVENEVLFTIAALRADPDAKGFEAQTAGWLPMVDAVRKEDRAVRQEVMTSTAARQVANGRLDAACVAFGHELFAAVRRDRASARWRQFFPVPASGFVRQALPRQVATVQGWLSGAKDDVLESHRGTLATWAKATGDALVEARSSSAKRGEVWEKREELADALTRERDGLHDALSQHAREQKLDRSWPDLFFRTDYRSEGSGSSERGEEPAPTSSEG